MSPSQMIARDQIDAAYDELHAAYEQLTRDAETRAMERLTLIDARVANEARIATFREALERIAKRGEYHSGPIAKAALCAEAQDTTL